MREPLILLFLISSYNLLLWYITSKGLSPVPLFPEDPYQIVLVTSFNSVLYLAWLFGDRHRTVKWMGYLFFFQILALSTFLSDLEVIVRNLPPVLLSFMITVLFESPTEKDIRSIEEERELLLEEMERIRNERKAIEAHILLLKRELDRLRENQKESDRERIAELEAQIKTYREKESRLLEANRRLFQFLELLRADQRQGGGSEKELKNLRRERKKLIKELIQLQELASLYSEENKTLRDEKEELGKRVRELSEELALERLNADNIRKEESKITSRVGEILSLATGVDFMERAVEEFLSLDRKRKKAVIDTLASFKRGERKGLHPLATISDVFRIRFSGGRIYLRRKGRKWVVVGILMREGDKDKERYIKEVLSKIEDV